MREQIIRLFEDRYQQDDRVNAFWLEGSDGLGRNDDYSDIDIWLDVEDGYEQAILDDCAQALSTLAPLDFNQLYDHPHPKIFQRNMHLAGTSEYLIIDLCLQSRSRGSEGCTFVEGDIAELPLVIFDKKQVVTVITLPPADVEEITRAYRECAETWAQRARVVKYLHRALYLEAHAYYFKYVAAQLVVLARLVHTPRHWDYGLVHISHHLPETLVKRLERLHQVTSLEEFAVRLPEADALWQELEKQLWKQYPSLKGNE